MAELRIRIELQRPSKGIEMSKLSKLAEETQRFLRMVAEDTGINPDEGMWVAVDFYNQGLGFNAEYQFAEIDLDQVSAYVHAVDSIASVDKSTKWSVRGIRGATVLQSARLAALADEGETIRFGLMNGTPQIEWRPLPKPKAAEIIEFYQAWVEYRGMLQGRIHSLFKEANPPYFTLRDFASGDLVRCDFGTQDWPSLHKALVRKDGVVFVAGWIRAKRVDKSISTVRVDRIQGTDPVSADQLRAFFGSAPGWTGDVSTDDFIDSLRRDDDGDQ